MDPEIVFVDFVIRNLVEYPSDVHLEKIIDDRGILLKLTVNPLDLGRVIGKRGATADAIRLLLHALGMRNNAKYNLKIVDPKQEIDDVSTRYEA